ncbi:MAG: HAD family hydrolase [Candidatus Binatia bacterium]
MEPAGRDGSVIRAILFDLDGTLVQTETLKAISYARAAVELRPKDVNEGVVVESFKEVVGLSRHEVALALMERFGLEDAARRRMEELGVNSPWQAFVQLRLRTYEAMLADPKILLAHQCPYNTALLQWARRTGYRTGLATMSYCAQATRVLEILGLRNEFDFVATREDVENGKPDPEIYRLVALELDIPPDECLVIEDSPSGVKAALAAGMWCIVVTSVFTHGAIHASGLLDKHWIVDDPAKLQAVVHRMVRDREKN